jgi:hypothetical protein
MRQIRKRVADQLWPALCVLRAFGLAPWCSRRRWVMCCARTRVSNLPAALVAIHSTTHAHACAHHLSAYERLAHYAGNVWLMLLVVTFTFILHMSANAALRVIAKFKLLHTLGITACITSERVCVRAQSVCAALKPLVNLLCLLIFAWRRHANARCLNHLTQFHVQYTAALGSVTPDTPSFNIRVIGERGIIIVQHI